MKKLLGPLAVAAAAALAIGNPAAVAAETETVTVTPNKMAGWVDYDTRAPGEWNLVEGPAGTPQGTGSLHLTTPDGSAKASIANGDYAHTPLSKVDAMSYWTYRASGEGQQAPSYQLAVDSNGAAKDGFTTLVFEPVYNTDQGPVVDDAWPEWDAFNDETARWWSTRKIPGVCATNCFVPWSAIVAANEDAGVLGVIVNAGSGNPGLDANVDAFTFGTADRSTTWDFELADQDGDGVEDGDDNCVEVANPGQEDADGDGIGTACDNPEAPVTKDDCKKGGWAGYDGTYTFRNQGDCVSFVATDGRNGPNA
jgi:hypothetical protein